MNAIRFLTLAEVQVVLKNLRRRAKRTVSGRVNLVIFRLACCCGLRRKEIAGLQLRDITTLGVRPCVRVRAAIAKGGKARSVPLWWDQGTLQDIREWVGFRVKRGARPADHVICGVRNGGARLSEGKVAMRWKSCIRSLGPQRVRQLSIHTGRHTFCSLSLTAGRTLVEVRDAAGHASINTTNIYLHLIPRDDVPDVFPQ